MAPVQRLFSIVAAFSALVLVTPAPNNTTGTQETLIPTTCNIKLAKPPLITEVVPYFTTTQTTCPGPGIVSLGHGCLAEIVRAIEPTVNVTEIATKTTTYPCSTSTTYTSGGCTYEWTPYTTSCPAPITYSCPTTTTTNTTASPTATPTLSCDPYGYLIQVSTLYRVDLKTGAYTQAASNIGDGSAINAMGYNVLDNYLYAQQMGDYTVLRIAASGAASVVATLGSGASANIGDVDGDGQYWFSSAGSNWFQMDLAPGSATYGKVVARGQTSGLPTNIQVADWVYLPVGGDYLYSVGVNRATQASKLLRWSRTSHAWQSLADYPTVKRSAWGAIYGMNNGTLYASDNTSGEIWAFFINGGAPVKVSNGPKSGQNDGARCVLNLL